MGIISISTSFVNMFVLFLISNAVDKHVYQSTCENLSNGFLFPDSDARVCAFSLLILNLCRFSVSLLVLSLTFIHIVPFLWPKGKPQV